MPEIKSIETLEIENGLLKLSHQNIITALTHLSEALDKNDFDREWWAVKTRQLIDNAKTIIQ